MMQVRFIHRQGDQVPDELREHGYTADTDFSQVVTYGVDYVVYVMCLSKGVIEYLIVDNDKGNRRPNWIPACLFQIIDPRLPFSWFYCSCRESKVCSVDAIWGYEEIATPDGKYYVDLIEREVEALQVLSVVAMR